MIVFVVASIISTLGTNALVRRNEKRKQEEEKLTKALFESMETLRLGTEVMRMDNEIEELFTKIDNMSIDANNIKDKTAEELLNYFDLVSKVNMLKKTRDESAMRFNEQLNEQLMKKK